MVALTQVSNALGTITPAQQMVAMAHAVGACTLVDGAQAVAHFPVNVRALDSDFYVFSGHKIYAPTGIGRCTASPRYWTHAAVARRRQHDQGRDL